MTNEQAALVAAAATYADGPGALVRADEVMKRAEYFLEWLNIKGGNDHR